MKTAQEKIDWLKENGVPWETILQDTEVDDIHYLFVSMTPNNNVLVKSSKTGAYFHPNFEIMEIVTPPKKTRKLYLWDVYSNYTLKRTGCYYDENGETISRGSFSMGDEKWKRKVESSMIEVDEDGNIL